MNKYILFISAALSVAFASIASIIPLWVANQWEVSAMLPTLITPATYTFSIWSIIYLSWIMLWAYYFIKWNFVKKKNLQLLAGAQVLSSLWLIPSQYLYIGTSFAVMLGVLWLLVKVFLSSRDEEKYFKYTVDLFLWWIIVASLANLHLVLVSFDIYIFPVFLTILSVVWALILNIYVIKKYNSLIPAGVLIWAAIWIVIWQDNTIIQVLAGISVLTLILVLFQKFNTPHTKQLSF